MNKDTAQHFLNLQSPHISKNILMWKLLKKILVGLLIAFFALVLWIGIDLLQTNRVQMREFDADEVARLDTVMWRSYYQREPRKLFFQLAELLRTQYKFSFWRSNLVAFYAARAAFVFKDGKNRADYEKALPDLVKFYTEIHNVSDIDFDTTRAAKLELEWWIIHRERQNHQEGDLARALAENAAENYQMPPEKFLEYGNLRAEAMKIRDTKAEEKSLSEEDWQKIDQLLHSSWRSLRNAVNP